MLPPIAQSKIIDQKSKIHRGAQLHNRNALKHGLYAVHTPTPISSLLSPRETFPLPADRDTSYYEQAIRGLREGLLQYLLAEPKKPDVHRLISWQKPVLKAIDSIRRLTVASNRCLFSSDQLRLVTTYPMQLIRWGFHQEGIDRDIAPPPSSDIHPWNFDGPTYEAANPPASFNVPTCQPVNVKMLSSIRPLAFLSDAQWTLIEPLLPQSEIKNPQQRPLWGSSIKRGRPASDPRLLLDAIFWKLSTNATWSDLKTLLLTPNLQAPSPDSILPAPNLPAPSPFSQKMERYGVRSRSASCSTHPAQTPSPDSILQSPNLHAPSPFSEKMERDGVRSLPPSSTPRPAQNPSLLTVRRFYRRLYLSGRLYTIYKALYKDYLSNSQSSLNDLASSACLGHDGKDIYFTSPMPNTCQTRTALLFLRLGYQNLRRLLKDQIRLNNPARRPHRLPSLLQPSLTIPDLEYRLSKLSNGSHHLVSKTEYRFSNIDPPIRFRPFIRFESVEDHSFRENPALSDLYSPSINQRDTGELDTGSLTH